MEKNKHHNRQKTMRISDSGLIELVGMEFHAFHGCLEQEKTEGNLFTVDFIGQYYIKKASKSDELSDAVDYGEIYKLIDEQMQIRSNLLENVAARIATAIADKFGDELDSFVVTVSKQNPPVGGKCAWSRVSVHWPKETLFDEWTDLRRRLVR